MIVVLGLDVLAFLVSKLFIAMRMVLLLPVVSMVTQPYYTSAIISTISWHMVNLPIMAEEKAACESSPHEGMLHRGLMLLKVEQGFSNSPSATSEATTLQNLFGFRAV